jgi:hypothetical protein
MEIKTHESSAMKIAEVVAEGIVVSSFEDSLELLANLYYQGFDKIVMMESHLVEDFFDLKSGFAGEMLQKFSTYKMKLAIVGDFSKYDSKSLSDFMSESNKGATVNFVDSLEIALITQLP